MGIEAGWVINKIIQIHLISLVKDKLRTYQIAAAPFNLDNFDLTC